MEDAVEDELDGVEEDEDEGKKDLKHFEDELNTLRQLKSLCAKDRRR